jgi:hypothetical protein
MRASGNFPFDSDFAVRRAYEECGIWGRLVRCTAVTAASCPIRPPPAPRSLGCRRFPFPSGQEFCCGMPAGPVGAGPGRSGLFIAAARWSMTSGLMDGLRVSSAIVLPFCGETKSCENRDGRLRAGDLRIMEIAHLERAWHHGYGVRAAGRSAAQVRLLEEKDFHCSTIGTAGLPVNPRRRIKGTSDGGAQAGAERHLGKASGAYGLAHNRP